VRRASRLIRLLLVVAATCALAGILAVSARAAGYWNVWQANLPDPDGVRSEHTPFPGGDAIWRIRESWTSGTHDMHFSFIGDNGSWTNISVFIFGTDFSSGSTYDQYVIYNNDAVAGGTAKAGCQNPSGDSTVFTNCRNASSL